MERRALIAFVVSLCILLGYQEILKIYYPPPTELEGTSPTPEIAPAASPPATADAGAEPQPEAPAAAIEGRDVVLDTHMYQATFTTAGARLKSFVLKGYRASVAKDSLPLDLLVDAVPGNLPLGIELRGAARKVTDGAVSYKVDRDELTLRENETGTLTFTGQLEGVTITKRIEADASRYLFGMAVDVQNGDGQFTELGVSWDKQVPKLHVPGREILFNSHVAIRGDKLEHVLWDKVDTIHDKDVRWVGYSGQYFLETLIPTADAGEARMWIKRHDEVVQTQLLLPPGQLRTRIDLYVGPKEIKILEAEEHGLRRAVDLGWFTFIALPLLQALKLLHRVTGNYGIDIILLTVIIKGLFIPLTRSSLKSMREMQKLQPQMAKIREQFKDKPDEMNKEIMELYRRHKVNPLGGCLPMVLQIPVFVGLYNALLNAVELRHAPFAGWIHDLSAPDRLGTIQLPFVEQPGIPVLTGLMGVSMFVQQLVTPATTADPVQQRVMLIMPVMFTFMFINFPSGLTLYWLVNNILTIAQQYTVGRPGK
jgi:YidC/Oxa1 family membrane protein insertase